MAYIYWSKKKRLVYYKIITTQGHCNNVNSEDRTTSHLDATEEEK